ncbi:hypothetical protein [Haloparvum sp. PAK95]|uniref:hypothetical protein n=1 Tax=Haloparvum sp. PAK95 TaxID=3418962 RepID=UPI003D2EA054
MVSDRTLVVLLLVVGTLLLVSPWWAGTIGLGEYEGDVTVVESPDAAAEDVPVTDRENLTPRGERILVSILDDGEASVYARSHGRDRSGIPPEYSGWLDDYRIGGYVVDADTVYRVELEVPPEPLLLAVVLPAVQVVGLLALVTAVAYRRGRASTATGEVVLALAFAALTLVAWVVNLHGYLVPVR